MGRFVFYLVLFAGLAYGGLYFYYGVTVKQLIKQELGARGFTALDVERVGRSILSRWFLLGALLLLLIEQMLAWRFAWGFVALCGAAAAALLVIYHAEVTSLINLYVVGVFTSLTLSQLGMVRHWRRARAEPAAGRHAVVNGVGAAATFVVLVVVLGNTSIEDVT